MSTLSSNADKVKVVVVAALVFAAVFAGVLVYSPTIGITPPVRTKPVFSIVGVFRADDGSDLRFFDDGSVIIKDALRGKYNLADTEIFISYPNGHTIKFERYGATDIRGMSVVKPSISVPLTTPAATPKPTPRPGRSPNGHLSQSQVDYILYGPGPTKEEPNIVIYRKVK